MILLSFLTDNSFQELKKTKTKNQRLQLVKLATGLKTESHKCSVSLVKRGVMGSLDSPETFSYENVTSFDYYLLLSYLVYN